MRCGSTQSPSCATWRPTSIKSDDQVEYAALAARIRASFEQAFWFEAGGYLYDVIDGPEGEPDDAGRRRDSSLRPNQIFALSLPHALRERREGKTHARSLRRGAVDARGLAIARSERCPIRRPLRRRPARARRRVSPRHGVDLAARPLRERALPHPWGCAGRARDSCAASRRTCAKAVSGKSVKSWMRTRRSSRVAALPRPGAWPKSCGPGAKSTKAKDERHAEATRNARISARRVAKG